MKQFLIAASALVCLVMGCQVAQARDADINGKWHFVFDTPDGGRDVDAELAVDANGKVTGKFGEADAAGTYKGGQLNMSFQITEPQSGETGPLKLVGKMDDDDLAGNWEFSSYSGTFTATRPKP